MPSADTNPIPKGAPAPQPGASAAPGMVRYCAQRASTSFTGALYALSLLLGDMERTGPDMDESGTVANWSATVHLIYAGIEESVRDLEKVLQAPAGAA